MNKKAEIGTIILLLLVVGAVYIINHPPKENTITIEKGKCTPSDIDTSIIAAGTEITIKNPTTNDLYKRAYHHPKRNNEKNNPRMQQNRSDETIHKSEKNG